MPSMNLVPVNGVIQRINSFSNNCCMLEVTIRNSDGITNFIVSPDTYVINEVRLRAGMNVTAFYDASLPIPLIFPPQYQAIFIGRRNPTETIYAGEFDGSLESLDGALKIMSSENPFGSSLNSESISLNRRSLSSDGSCPNKSR